MRADVVRSWEAILQWLRDYSPATAALVRSAASEADLAAVERAVGVDLPDDLRTWWRLTDGVEDGYRRGIIIPPFYQPYSIRDALRDREMWAEIFADVNTVLLAQADAQPAGTFCDVWLPRWLPLAQDLGGEQLFVDLRDGPGHGGIFEYAAEGGSAAEPLYETVAAMLDEIASALTRNEPAVGCWAVVNAHGWLGWRADNHRQHHTTVTADQPGPDTWPLGWTCTYPYLDDLRRLDATLVEEILTASPARHEALTRAMRQLALSTNLNWVPTVLSALDRKTWMELPLPNPRLLPATPATAAHTFYSSLEPAASTAGTVLIAAATLASDYRHALRQAHDLLSTGSPDRPQ